MTRFTGSDMDAAHRVSGRAAYARRYRQARTPDLSGDHVLRVFRCPAHGAFLVLVSRLDVPTGAPCPMLTHAVPDAPGDLCPEWSPWHRPPREANLDGQLHVENDCCGEGDTLGRVCSRCGGRVHEQPVYGGIASCCEGCDRDQDAWEPSGAYLRDSSGSVRGLTGVAFATGPTSPGVADFETVERSAVLHDDVVYSTPRPGRHSDVCRAMSAKGLPPEATSRWGFMTSRGRFVGPEEALGVASRAGQIEYGSGHRSGRLSSEDVW